MGIRWEQGGVEVGGVGGKVGGCDVSVCTYVRITIHTDRLGASNQLFSLNF